MSLSLCVKYSGSVTKLPDVQPHAPSIPSNPYYPARKQPPPVPPTPPSFPPRNPVSNFPPLAPGNTAAQALVEVAQQLWDPFGLLESWGKTTDPCDGWLGVSCGVTGIVTELDLGVEFDLRGDLPEALSGVTSLESIGKNQLSSSIPESWGETMVNMKFLDLSFNGALCGVLPPSLEATADTTGTRIGVPCDEPNVDPETGYPYGPYTPDPQFIPLSPSPPPPSPPSPPPFPPPEPPQEDSSNWVEDNLALFIIIIILGILIILLIILAIYLLLQRRKQREADLAIASANESAGKAMQTAMEAQTANAHMQTLIMQQQQQIQYQQSLLQGDEPPGPPPAGMTPDGQQIPPEAAPPPPPDDGEYNPPRPTMAEGDYVANTHMQYYGTRRV
eukprot:gene3489-13555_t